MTDEEGYCQRRCLELSAWTAEALKLTMPAASFSRSTESHNQDKVSMGTIAARDCLRVLELTEQVAAAMVLATHQALLLRGRGGELDPAKLDHLGGVAREICRQGVIDELTRAIGPAVDERIEQRERHDDEVEPLAADDVRRQELRLDTARS